VNVYGFMSLLENEDPDREIKLLINGVAKDFDFVLDFYTEDSTLYIVPEDELDEDGEYIEPGESP
jgi:ketosteroid isomerase-like protein